MKDKIKTILKYGIILAIIVGIGFGVKAIFFPTPKPDDAYNNLTSIVENETYKELINANNQLINLVTKSMNPKKLKTVIIVHGGEDERLHMIEELQQRLGSQKQVITLKEEETIRFF